MKTVLITAIGGDIAQSVARLARGRFPELELVGTDMSDEHAGSLFVDEVLRVPRADDAGYVEAIASIVRARAVDCVIPMAEAELAALLPLIESGALARWITAGPAAIRAGVDKLETMRALERAGIAVPWTLAVGEGDPPELPCILKERRSSGSRGVHTIATREDARYHAARHPDAVYQALLPDADREVTCAVYRTADSRVSTLQLRRRLAGGFTSWAVVIDDPAIDAMCAGAAEALDLRGAMNVQLRMTPAGPRIFEINPRYSSTALMRHEIGYTDVVWAFDELEGRAVAFRKIPPGTVVVRTQGAAVLRAGAGDTSGRHT